MNSRKFRFAASIYAAMICMLLAALCICYVSCSNEENEENPEFKYGTFVGPDAAHFLFDQDSIPYLPVSGPHYSREEYMNKLAGYRWIQVPDSSYNIQHDGTCRSTLGQRLPMPSNDFPYLYTPMDLFITDSCIYFYSGPLEGFDDPYKPKSIYMEAWGGHLEGNLWCIPETLIKRDVPFSGHFSIVYFDGEYLATVHRPLYNSYTVALLDLLPYFYVFYHRSEPCPTLLPDILKYTKLTDTGKNIIQCTIR